jgi:hypothetical protein
MVTNGKCCACHEEGKEKDGHHIIPRRFTRQGRNKIERLDILFPECFPSGRNDITNNSLCRKCHQRLDRLIPFDDLMTPDKYFLIFEMFLSGESIGRELIGVWIRESEPEIRKRQMIYFDLSDEFVPEISTPLLCTCS